MIVRFGDGLFQPMTLFYILISLLPLRNTGGVTFSASMDQPPLVCGYVCVLHCSYVGMCLRSGLHQYCVCVWVGALQVQTTAGMCVLVLQESPCITTNLLTACLHIHSLFFHALALCALIHTHSLMNLLRQRCDQ